MTDLSAVERGEPSTRCGGLRIPVVSAIGRGQTLISSFDDALRQSGVHNYNLIPLSSVIPPHAEIVSDVGPWEQPPEEYGHRLYVVKAEARSAEPGMLVAAGIGWMQWGDGRGVFVETELVEPYRSRNGPITQRLTDHLTTALRDLCAFRNVPFGQEQGGTRVTVGLVGKAPTTALALAVYRSEGWNIAPPNVQEGSRR